MREYTTVIGLEVHVQLNTESKAFCSDKNQFGDAPNINIGPVSLALPGTLPVLNTEQIKSSIKLAYALNSKINLVNGFDRKNYFYPDLPKGYQITQDRLPICEGGILKFHSEGQLKSVRIHHVHMEEDAGKNSHDLHPTYSMVDINRAGTPLVEIVTEPDLRSAQEVHDFIAALQQLVRYLDISDGNMEEGSLRCDVNVSVMPKGSSTYGERNEIKNVNSKKFAKTAVEYESKRQIKILEQGGAITMNTLLFNPETGTTKPMRTKEEANDYRYFPDPDLPPLQLTQEYIDDIVAQVELLPWTAKTLLIDEHHLSEYDAEIISRDKGTVQFFRNFQISKDQHHASTLSSFIINKVLPFCQENNKVLDDMQVDNISKFILLLDSEKISKSAGLNAMSELVLKSTEPMDLEKVAKDLNLIQSEDQDFLDDLIDSILSKNIDKVKAYQNGKKGLLGFFMGQVMGQAKGKANPKILTTKLSKALEEKDL
ncbi:MAG: Asp-tRNA(Asn)/Glu-tRNA(Gln) amidotransferase subunit GatB [Saprospiraceae bacterium]|nr:Asp-tRNA(Asn)/Glu-tRNA(Gln) amidotransferase subunit GatB [Saprospiraceae bacterium]